VKRFWFIGIVIAAIGVILARVVPGFVQGSIAQSVLFVLGVTFVLAGVGVIVFGLNRKVRQNPPK
jgi:hypothetical protein